MGFPTPQANGVMWHQGDTLVSLRHGYTYGEILLLWLNIFSNRSGAAGATRLGQAFWLTNSSTKC